MNSWAPIAHQIASARRKLSGESLRALRKAAKTFNVKSDSLLWMLTPVFPSGHVRSSAYRDCPPCVVEDGLVKEIFDYANG
jgi:hypothetical protein